ncbi:MAG: deoxyribose-phosphate aldolase [Mycoplasma sp.]|nr:deoxyribose-phosphate aldolase [Mycoplasma sp.]
MKELNCYIEHTNLKPNASIKDIDLLIEQAIKYQFRGICIAPCFVKYAKEKLKNTNIKVITVIGFPLGYSTTQVKIFEANQAILDGADEIDMVINNSHFIDRKYDIIKDEINKIKKVISNITLKVIIETAILSSQQIIKISEIILDSGADFIKTSTGFSSRGASHDDIKLIKSVVKDQKLIKAAGGIKTKQDALEMIELGANTLGCSNSINFFD